MTESILTDVTRTFRQKRDLPGDDAGRFVDALLAESDEARLSELFRGWEAKGIAEEEIYSISRVMRDRCVRVRSRHDRLLDIVGTGGSRAKTFNVSTAAAFVTAGAGAAVAKHGNRAATSNSGNADVLSELGIEPAVDNITAERCLNDVGICFMFAPNFHRLSPTLGKVRRELGFPTVFNCVGPLCNPASASFQVIGVWRKDLVPKMASALARLGTGRSWVVYGEDGLDEISPAGKTTVAEVCDGRLNFFEISPGDFGIQPHRLDDCRAGSAAESGKLVRGILSGVLNGSAAAIVLMNAAAAIHLSGASHDLAECVDIAKQSIRDGRAAKKISQLAEAVKR